MASFPVLLCFTAVLFPLFPAHGKEESFDSLSTCLPNIQNEIIDKHNALRRSVSPTASNMLKMKWSEEAATNAQIWADKCTLSHSTSEYRKLNTSTCGENLFMSSHAATWSSGIQAWFNESSNFIYGVGAKTKGAIIEHYTQVVWFSSSLVGCAVSYCPDAYQKYYYVCQYCPGGNIKDKINVPYLRGPRCAACPNDCDNGLCNFLRNPQEPVYNTQFSSGRNLRGPQATGGNTIVRHPVRYVVNMPAATKRLTPIRQLFRPRY